MLDTYYTADMALSFYTVGEFFIWLYGAKNSLRLEREAIAIATCEWFESEFAFL